MARRRFGVAGYVRPAVPADDLVAAAGVTEPGADGFEVLKFQAVIQQLQCT